MPLHTSPELDRIAQRSRAVEAELRALDAAGDWTPAQRSRWETLTAEVPELEDQRAREFVRVMATDTRNVERVGQPTTPTRTRQDHPMLDAPYRAARDNLDTAVRSGILPDHAAQHVTALLEHGPANERAIASRWAAATGDPTYLAAFSKLLGDPLRGHLLWTPEEGTAYRRVEEFRAMSLTNSAGGYMVPLTLDPAILLTSAGSINPLRRISRVVRTVTDTWNGITSAGVTAEWLAEAAQAADAAPTLAQPSIPVHKGAAFVPYSYEVGMDALDFAAELGTILVDGADQLQATAYTTGTGTGQPTGVITALVGTASEINGGGSEALAAGDPLLLQNDLPARFSEAARWCANIAIINTIAAFETTNGALRFPEVADGRLLRKPIHELSNMDGTINAAATANNYVLVYGDFASFVIADRIGTTIETIPNLVGANNRPTGQRGAFLWFRTGSDVVVDNAFRLLDVPTTA